MPEERMPTMTQHHPFIRFIYKAPVVLLFLIGSYFGIRLVLDFKEDTTLITNAAFAILATLASLSFSFARVAESSELKDQLMYAGERLLHGSILVLVASLLKFLVLSLLSWPLLANIAGLEVAVMGTIGLLSALMFLHGVIFAHTGLRMLNDLLLMRMTRRKEWDSF